MPVTKVYHTMWAHEYPDTWIQTPEQCLGDNSHSVNMDPMNACKERRKWGRYRYTSSMSFHQRSIAYLIDIVSVNISSILWGHYYFYAY